MFAMTGCKHAFHLLLLLVLLLVLLRYSNCDEIDAPCGCEQACLGDSLKEEWGHSAVSGGLIVVVSFVRGIIVSVGSTTSRFGWMRGGRR